MGAYPQLFAARVAQEGLQRFIMAQQLMSEKAERDVEVPANGAVANQRLTALTGGLLFLLLGLIGITILSVRSLLPQHLLLGFVLIPPMALKIASTGYRFMRYYLRDPLYRQAGPPPLYLRLLAPLVVLTTVALFVSGLELWYFGLRFGSLVGGAVLAAASLTYASPFIFFAEG